MVDALECAVEIQKELKDRNEELPKERRMPFRIGIHLGDVIEEEGKIYGDGVNRINPKFTVESFTRILPYKNSSDRDRVAQGLRKAGLP